MKSFASAALFVAAVLAQDPATSIVNRCQNSVDRNLNNTPATVRPIAEGLFQINITTGALDDQVLAFDGSQATIDSLLAASSALLADIANATTTTSAVEPLTTDNENDALYLVQYVADVVCTANKTVDDLIAIKGAIVDSCQGPVALSQLQQQLAATIPLINITANKIPDDQGLSGFARVLAQPILDSLQQGIDAYADQTALPASCTSTSTTTSTSTATTTATGTVTSTDAGVTTTTAIAGSTYGSSSHGASYTTVTEDCEESSTYGPTKSASYSPAPTGGNGGGAYHSGAPYPTGPYSSSSGPYKSGFTTSCTEGAYYGSSSASKSSSSSAYGGYPSSSPSKGGNGGYGGAVPSSSAYGGNGGNGGYGGAVPSSSAYGGNGGNGGYPSSSASKSSYVPSSSASKGGYGGAVPTGGYSSGGKSNSTGGYGSSPYTGAASATAANVFGLLVAAIGAVALL